jgi:hypothetical protein
VPDLPKAARFFPTSNPIGLKILAATTYKNKLLKVADYYFTKST